MHGSRELPNWGRVSGWTTLQEKADSEQKPRQLPGEEQALQERLEPDVVEPCGHDSTLSAVWLSASQPVLAAVDPQTQ